MAKVGLLQVDGKLPNLALMQVTAYYEKQGWVVEWYKGNLFEAEYDEIYASKIFAFSKTPDLPARAKIGGTGIDFLNRLPPEIEAMRPSYSLYTNLKDDPNWHSPIDEATFHLGFSMKGCRFRCKFCCVPTKEGRPRINNTIEELLINPKGEDRLLLLDNDFFGGPDWKDNILYLIQSKLRVNFNQGLNIRILKDEQAELLSQVRYYNTNFSSRYLTFAWDRFQDGKLIFDGIERCEKYGIPASHMQFFVLIGFDSTPEQDLERVTRLAERGALPYVMPYNKHDPYQKKFARWVNHRAIFKTTPWSEYGQIKAGALTLFDEHD